MKILFCTPVAVKQEFGASRALLGVAGGLTTLGWDCRVAGPEEVHRHAGGGGSGYVGYTEALRVYLRDVAAEYDVVDYPYDHLPYSRDDFPRQTLFVARSVLLAHHFAHVRIPEVILVRQRVKRFLTGLAWRQRAAYARVLEDARVTLANADLVNVLNEDDRAVLISSGVDPQKIVILLNGLSTAEIDTLSRTQPAAPDEPRLCFVGSFDHRKGGADLPRLLAEVSAHVPGCRLRLLGTAGLHQTETRVRAFFPKKLQGQLEVVPRFRRDELAGLLAGCTAGVFPSYVEGFGLGVLEMMMAGMPVVAYRSPGPPMMLPDELLSPRGDVADMAERAVDLLLQAGKRQRLVAWCRTRAREFTWDAVGAATDRCYRRAKAGPDDHPSV